MQRNNFGLSVAVDIGSDHVMRATTCLVIDVALEFLFARALGVAVPYAAADDIQPAIAIHVQGACANIGEGIMTEDMFDPSVRRLILVPVERSSDPA